MAIEQNERRGMTPAEARRAAYVAFGGVERYRERVREVRGVVVLLSKVNSRAGTSDYGPGPGPGPGPTGSTALAHPRGRPQRIARVPQPERIENEKGSAASIGTARPAMDSPRGRDYVGGMDWETAERFEAMDARFDAVDARFDRMLAGIAQQFELMQRRADERHEQLLEFLWQRFDQIDRRFEAHERRFDAIDRRFDTERANVAGLFEAQQKHIDRRFDLQAEAFHDAFANHERRIRALERNAGKE